MSDAAQDSRRSACGSVCYRCYRSLLCTLIPYPSLPDGHAFDSLRLAKSPAPWLAQSRSNADPGQGGLIAGVAIMRKAKRYVGQSVR